MVSLRAMNPLWVETGSGSVNLFLHVLAAYRRILLETHDLIELQPETRYYAGNGRESLHCYWRP